MARMGGAFMPADDYGRGMRPFSVNLLVRDTRVSLAFYERVVGAAVRDAEDEFAVLKLLDFAFMLHAGHTYHHHTLYRRLQRRGPRGAVAGLRGVRADPGSI